MKINISRGKSFFAALALAVVTGPVWTQAQAPKPARYTVADLGTLPGGTFSQSTSRVKRKRMAAPRASTGIAAISASVNRTFSPPRLSSSCVTLLAPIMMLATTGFASSHASAT